MTSSPQDYLAELKAQRASAKRQLDLFTTGKMRWKMSGVDRTEHHISALKKAIANFDKLIELYGGGEAAE